MKVTANELHLPDNDNNDASFGNKSEVQEKYYSKQSKGSSGGKLKTEVVKGEFQLNKEISFKQMLNSPINN